MKVIVTGAAGMLGRHVAAAYVDAGHDVLGLDVRDHPAAAWSHVITDICDLGNAVQLFDGADAVAHCAGLPRPIGFSPSDVYKTNMASIYATVEAARLCGVGLFLYASSISVLGYPFAKRCPIPHYLPVDEDHPIAAQEIYGTTKWLGEELIEATVRAGGFRAISLRMPWVQTCDSFARDVVPRRESADAAADLWAYLDARDAGQAFVKALDWRKEQHLRCFLSAHDSYCEIPTQQIVQAAFGAKVSFKKDLTGHAALLDTSLAQQAFGFSPVHSWRDYGAERGVK
ncbi:NAD-dependent epimerase/dehydratase family protein [Rhodalgimonas zhirmunskyi]|uniref:NAD(P)-dependent oxidoreductase n=1 Tax=Rhodalgimonas zhirmunskyi TaxID=2964767 RepID=A0AAJ1U9E6_9RHOB|nr:NAD(P)-dependent oxidoreductase [Rhodoalgimonas zhirmunskyi]MDQ2093598.1 NAD(P)-dependent oxidoreductase [Rhodoalgimonas zhirmunskyi]